MIGFPFDSIVTDWIELGEDRYPVYDRTYTSRQLANINAMFFTNGIMASYLEELAVTVNGMIVTVGYGGCVIRGRFGDQSEEEGRTVLNLETGDSLPRIDTVVAVLDLSISRRNIFIEMRKGTPSSSPTAPSLTRTSSIYELGLANILVPANATSVSQSNVTDTRLDSSRCGLAAPFMSIDTSTFYYQIQSALSEGLSKQQAAADKAMKDLTDATDRAIIFADRLISDIDGQPCGCHTELEQVKQLLYELLGQQDEQYYYVGKTLYVPRTWGSLSDDTLTLTNNARFNEKEIELS